MQFINAIREQADAQAKADFEDYRSLVARAVAAGGKLNAADTKQLAKLAAARGFQPERVEADADVLRKADGLRAEAATFDAATAAYNQAVQAEQAHEAETAEILRQRGEQAGKLFAESRSLMAAAGRARDAAAAVKELEGRHWRLLGIESPEAATRRRHLVQTVGAKPVKYEATCEVIEFEDLMHAPRGIDGIEFVPVEGQTEEQLAALVALAKSFPRGDPQALAAGAGAVFYLMPPDAAEAITERSGRVLTVKQAVERGWFGVTFVPAPGQRQAELDALRAEVVKAGAAAAREKERRRREANHMQFYGDGEIAVGKVGPPESVVGV